MPRVARLLNPGFPPTDLRIPQIFEDAKIIQHQGDFYVYIASVLDETSTRVYQRVDPLQVWESSKRGWSASDGQ